MHLELRRLLLVASIIGAIGCGVRFGDDWDGTTELFKEIRLTGPLTPGTQLVLTTQLTQVYPVPIRIACFYEDGDRLTDDLKKLAFEERGVKIGEKILAPAIAGRPDRSDETPSETITFRFSIPDAGDYFVACMTPAAPDNGLGLIVKIRP